MSKADHQGKQKGPIRFEAIVPFGVVVGVVVAYFVLFFDFQLRKGMEWTGSYLNGAEVNISSLSTSFVRGTFELEGLDVTDPRKPSQNRFSIGAIRFGFLWDALLRMKFVVEQSEVTGIRVLTPRKEPGFVLDRDDDEETSSLTADLKALVKEQTGGVTLSQAMDVLSGVDPSKKLKNIGELKSIERIEGLEKDLATQEKAWDQALSEVPGESQVKAIEKRINDVRIGGNPNQIRNQISSLSALKGDVNRLSQDVQNKSNGLTEGVNSFSKKVGQIDRWIDEDRKRIESELKLPRLDAKSLSRDLFGASFARKIAEAEKYSNLVKEHMGANEETPGNDSAAKKKAPRHGGKNYFFPRKGSYPFFWLKRALVSSKTGASEYSGDVEGELRDWTSEPKLLGKPAVLTLKGDFPKQNVRGVMLQVTVDRTREIPKDVALVNVDAYPVADQYLTKSDEVRLGFKQATGTLRFNGRLTGDRVGFVTTNSFRRPRYDIKAKSAVLQSVLRESVGSLRSVDVRASARGTWSDLNWKISSNLGDALGKGFQRRVSAKLNEARRRIHEAVDQKVGGARDRVTQRYDGARQKVNGQIAVRKAQVNTLHAKADAKIGEAKQKLARAAAPAKKAVKGIKKRFGF